MTTTETFYVENMKCGGCVQTIKNTLGKMLGVQGVEVYLNEEKICVMGIAVNRAKLKQSLSTIGYPEKGKNSILRQVKSVISCGLGRV